MAYNDLSESTLTPDERVAEKDRIISKLVGRLGGLAGHLTDAEHNFVGKMDRATSVSVKQLFWLRDIAEKY